MEIISNSDKVRHYNFKWHLSISRFHLWTDEKRNLNTSQRIWEKGKEKECEMKKKKLNKTCLKSCSKLSMIWHLCKTYVRLWRAKSELEFNAHREKHFLYRMRILQISSKRNMVKKFVASSTRVTSYFSYFTSPQNEIIVEQKQYQYYEDLSPYINLLKAVTWTQSINSMVERKLSI